VIDGEPDWTRDGNPVQVGRDSRFDREDVPGPRGFRACRYVVPSPGDTQRDASGSEP
jgi:hypothetical protein